MSEKLERQYEQSPLIAQIFIHGDSLRSNIVAIAHPEYTSVKAYLISLLDLPADDPTLESLHTILANPATRDATYKAVEADLERLAKQAKFNSLEKVRGNFRLMANEFEVGTVLTPTMKLRRNVAKEIFKQEIEEIYERCDREAAATRE